MLLESCEIGLKRKVMQYQVTIRLSTRRCDGGILLKLDGLNMQLRELVNLYQQQY